MANLLSNTTIGGYQSIHTGNIGSYALPLSGGALTGQLYINNGDPTIFLQDTNHRSAMIHVNSNVFYVLRGTGNNSTGWSTYNGYWPLELNLENNNAQFGGSVSAPVGDFRAPIFYDSQNTAYYLDPNSTSNLNVVNLSTLNASDTNARYYYQNTNGVPSNNLGNPTVTEMALFDEQFNNKTAFYNPASLTFWTSSDGTNYTEYTGFDTTTKKRFLGGDNDSGVFIPNLTNRFRIEVENSAGYVFLNQLYIYWSSNSHSTKVHIWVRRCDNNQWYQWTSSDQYVSSWPGHLYLPFGGIPFYPGYLDSTGHYNKIRIEFIPSWSSGTYSYTGINLMRMQIWGGYPAGKRNIYSTDENQNVSFPATLSATTFSGALSGNATTASALTSMNISQFTNNSGYLTSLPSHTHDDRYFTESESDARFQPLENQRLSTGNSPTFAEIYNNGWFRNNNTNTGLFNQANGNHFYSRSGTQWAITSNGTTVGSLMFYRNHESVLEGQVYFDTSGFGLLNRNADWAVRSDRDNTSVRLYYNGGERVRTDSQGAYVTGRLDVSNYIYTPQHIIAKNIQGTYQVLNLDTPKEPGLYQYDGGIGGTQPAGTDWFNVKTIEIGVGGRYSQFVMPYSNNRVFYRSQVGGTWLSYVELITSENIGSQSVSYATTAGALSSMNISQFTNNNGYITSSANVAGLNTTGLGNGTTNIDSGFSRVIRNENGLGGNPPYAPVLHLATSDTMWQIAGAHAGQTTLVWRSGYSGAWNTPWWTIYHSGNFTDNSSNWNTAYSWGNHASAGYQSASTAITTGNIGSQSVSYATTAGSAPANGGNSSTVGGYSVSVGASANTIPTRNSSGYLIPESWIQLNGTYGLYSPTNNAHLRPNSGSYGSWQMTGSRNGWQGIEFDSGNAGAVSVMVQTDSNTSGFHNNSYGWQIKWSNGTLYIGKNSYGGGTEATVLDSSNYSSWAQPIASAINTGNIGSQSVSYATTAGTANAVAWGNVSSKPSLLMYYQGFTLDANTMDGNSTGFTYSVNAPFTGPIARFSETGYSLQLNAAYSGGGTGIAFRTRNGDAGSFNPWRVLLNDANYTAYSPSLTGSGASGTWGINVTGSAGSVAWTNVSSRPTNLSQFTNDLGNYGGWITSSGSISGNAATATNVAWTGVTGRPTALSQFSNDLGNYGGWLTTGGKAADSELIDGIDSSRIVFGDGARASTYVSSMDDPNQKSGFFFKDSPTGQPFGDWWNWMTVAGNSWQSSNNYSFQIAHAFHSDDAYIRRMTAGTAYSWRTLITSGNIGSQSVSYANSAGSATTAGSATSASQLTKYGDIYGQDWNSYYISNKLIVSAALGMSGANKPPTSYDYGVALSYGEAGGPLLQMYFPENQNNIGTIFRKGTYRTGWNGNWSTWKTLVEQEGNLCTIVGGNAMGLEVHGNVGYNQDPLTYFLLRGQADTSWKALKIRLTGDAGGQDIEFRRIAENGTDSRMWYVPRGANTVNFDYPIVQPSDSRLKDNIIPISTPVDKIKSLRGVEFDWNSGEQVGTHDVGLIAQDVEAVLPEAVTTQEDGYKNLAYTKVIPLLVEAMKEQQAMIEALRAEIELLKAR